MNSTKILLLTTYPIKNPQHGGQKRAAAIYDAYQAKFATVRQSAVFFRGFYSDFGPDDIALGQHGEQLVMQSPLTGDIICGEAIYKDPAVKKKMTQLLEELKPDIIHIEQPFPYLGLEPLLDELGRKPKLVFGSQNVEAPMKREILENAGSDETAIKQAEQTIEDVEKQLTVDCDLLVACTTEDLKAHQAMGAKQVVLAPNGIAEIIDDPASRDYWSRKFKNIGVTKKVLFVGSAHPPNWTGFIDMVGKGLGFVSFDARIVIAGSICDYFDREISTNSLDIEDATFWLRAFSAGRLSEKRLGALIHESDVMLLPITEGGGSNLKTAEAILANKKVVATNHALRSFEWFKDFPNVWVADTQAAFRESIGEALNADFEPRTTAQQTQAKQVLWSNSLSDMVSQVGKL
jgi:hypothetical protein